ncbi:putative zinc-type alcohol dehydrogenase-like protein yoga [Podospora conica]|nr:putative zinc-type alcohol dehydrogenase-like protein yoga [Schizothecium conicum]
MPYTLTVKKTDGKPGQVWYPLQLNTIPQPVPGPGQVLVKISAVALNHRDLFIRQHLYPNISFTHPLLSDASGVVTALGPSPSPRATSLLHRPVLLTPSRGWASDPLGPEAADKFSVVGASALTPVGTAAEYVVVDEDEVVPMPGHLTPEEGAALPLCGVTAWRAVVGKSGNAEAGRNLLVTGVGGGVALMAVQIAVARGCNVWVTSGSEEKVKRAVEMGARGGVVYGEKGWERRLEGMLPGERRWLDAVVDGAGGEVVGKTVRLLKAGGVIVVYGMTVGPRMDWTMQAVLKNVEVRGSTMGSRREFAEMVRFVEEKRIKPVVSRVVRGLDNLEGIEGLFEDMKGGRQFGKLVVLVDKNAEAARL